MVGILISVLGAVIINVWQTDSSGSDDIPLGSLIVSWQVVSMACIIVFQKPLLKVYDPAFVTVVYYSIGTFFTILLFAGWSYRIPFSSMSFDGALSPWFALIYAVIFPSILAYNLYSWAGKRLNPSTTTLYTTLQPATTILLSYIVFGDSVGGSDILGGFFIILGLFVIVYGGEVQTVLVPSDSSELVNFGGSQDYSVISDDRNEVSNRTETRLYEPLPGE